MPGPHEIVPAVLACTHQITSGLRRDCGDRDRHDLPQLEQPRKMRDVAGIGFHPIPGGALQLRGGSDHALDPGIGEVAGEVVSRGAGLVDDLGRAGRVRTQSMRWKGS